MCTDLTSFDVSGDIFGHGWPPERVLDEAEGTRDPRMTSADRSVDPLRDTGPHVMRDVLFVWEAVIWSWFFVDLP